MRTITLEISDAAFKRLRSTTIARSMANMGESQDILRTNELTASPTQFVDDEEEGGE